MDHQHDVPTRTGHHRTGGPTSLQTTGCPQCGAPAEITRRHVLGGTAGPVEHVGVVCVRRHRFLMPVDGLPGVG